MAFIQCRHFTCKLTRIHCQMTWLMFRISILLFVVIREMLCVDTTRCICSDCHGMDFSSFYFNYTLDCCTLQVPLHHADLFRRLITISTTHWSSERSLSNVNTLIVLMGGSGWNLFPDHRRTGLSTILGCNEENSQQMNEHCLEYLKRQWGIEGLNQFSIILASHDLARQIESDRNEFPSSYLSIYGISYGTLQLDRFLQIYPTLVRSAVMDGVLHRRYFSVLVWNELNVPNNSRCLSHPIRCWRESSMRSIEPNNDVFASIWLMIRSFFDWADLKRRTSVRWHSSFDDISSPVVVVRVRTDFSSPQFSSRIFFIRNSGWPRMKPKWLEAHYSTGVQRRSSLRMPSMIRSSSTIDGGNIRCIVTGPNSPPSHRFRY